jgi:signal transduction histidine kinase
MHDAARLEWLRKLGIVIFIYLVLFAALYALHYRPPQMVFALGGMAVLAGALSFEIWGGLLLGGLSTAVTLPFLPVDPGFYTHWVPLIGLAYLTAGAGIGWANRRGRVRQKQRQVRQSSLHRELYRRSLNLLQILSPSGEVLESNDRAIERLGQPKHLAEFVHFDDLERLREELDRARVRGESSGVSLRLISWEKQAFPVEFRIVRLDGQRLALEMRDISERAELERRLCEAEARYRYLIEDAIDTLDTGIMMLDADRQVIWANQTIGYFFNIDRDEMTGREIGRLLRQLPVVPEDPESLRRISEAGAESFVFSLRQGTEERILQFRSLPIETDRYRGGRIDHYIDITEIKLLERELVEKTERLEESNRKLEQFSHVVSHDLKEPLRTIEAFSGFLLEDYLSVLSEEGTGYLKSMQRSAARMKHMIDDLLRLASIGTKREPLEEVDLSELLSEVRENMEAALAGVDLQVAADLPTVTGNRTRLAELFTNLLSNAIKYNDKPHKQVDVACQSVGDENHFSVRDNGIGIDNRYLEKIFELFERLNPREDYESTGAGLAICKRIVEEFGGRIWAESQEGVGSSFHFTWPRQSRKPALLPQRLITEGDRV